MPKGICNKRGPTRFPGSARYAAERGISHSHVYRVLMGQRESASLTADFAAWSAAQAGAPRRKSATPFSGLDSLAQAMRCAPTYQHVLIAAAMSMIGPPLLVMDWLTGKPLTEHDRAALKRVLNTLAKAHANSAPITPQS